MNGRETDEPESDENLVGFKVIEVLFPQPSVSFHVDTTFVAERKGYRIKIQADETVQPVSAANFYYKVS